MKIILKHMDYNLLQEGNYAKSDTIKEMVVNETLVKKLGVKNPTDAIRQRNKARWIMATSCRGCKRF